jgi:hypothetical protein
MAGAMKSQRGFFGFGLGNITPYVVLAVAVVMLCMGWALRHEYRRANAAEGKLAAVAAIGKAKEHDNALQAAADLRNKERADDESKRRNAAHLAELNRLRKLAGRSLVPAAPASAVRADLACFDRAELDTAIRSFVAGIVELVGDGEQATLDLDIAKRWGQP